MQDKVFNKWDAVKVGGSSIEILENMSVEPSETWRTVIWDGLYQFLIYEC